MSLAEHPFSFPEFVAGTAQRITLDGLAFDLSAAKYLAVDLVLELRTSTHPEWREIHRHPDPAPAWLVKQGRSRIVLFVTVPVHPFPVDVHGFTTRWIGELFATAAPPEVETQTRNLLLREPLVVHRPVLNPLDAQADDTPVRWSDVPWLASEPSSGELVWDGAVLRWTPTGVWLETVDVVDWIQSVRPGRDVASFVLELRIKLGDEAPEHLRFVADANPDTLSGLPRASVAGAQTADVDQLRGLFAALVGLDVTVPSWINSATAFAPSNASMPQTLTKDALVSSDALVTVEQARAVLRAQLPALPDPMVVPAHTRSRLLRVMLSLAFMTVCGLLVLGAPGPLVVSVTVLGTLILAGAKWFQRGRVQRYARIHWVTMPPTVSPVLSGWVTRAGDVLDLTFRVQKLQPVNSRVRLGWVLFSDETEHREIVETMHSDPQFVGGGDDLRATVTVILPIDAPPSFAVDMSFGDPTRGLRWFAELWVDDGDQQASGEAMLWVLPFV